VPFSSQHLYLFSGTRYFVENIGRVLVHFQSPF
jgi:hypothetical protein